MPTNWEKMKSLMCWRDRFSTHDIECHYGLDSEIEDMIFARGSHSFRAVHMAGESCSAFKRLVLLTADQRVAPMIETSKSLGS